MMKIDTNTTIFTGADCVVQLITKLQELSERCVAEVRMNHELATSIEDKHKLKTQHHVIYVMGDSQQIITK
jgi:hypothetical protein